ncbi:UDP-glucose--hexose-1-phosphate uridylyltransferase [Fervidibacillus halotolerans]|uniref:Galactose-1-phosphate uridylyltransferase n=1 Tax=Fervidibacillus halotolerans TaxID=2980027 RepID=A0A9E8M1F4_9BACI|nr:UDP-glucose--hexose-1-phosphate uridylyltransferase [Fervidibacillus halotolerans]WAA12534.1 UDP-glucose--hexose-1-phosphate uridylyltransferase [Fervidibacillus halotolerans]
MTINQLIQQLIDEGNRLRMIKQEDEIYIRNRILSLLKLDTFSIEEKTEPFSTLNGSKVDEDLIIVELVESIVEYATREKLIDDYFDEKEIFSAKLIDCFLSRPSEVNEKFWQDYRQSPKKATDEFYHFSKLSNYIQMKRIKRNIFFQVPTEYGALDITINLSKPEKDPRQIALERSVPKEKEYPRCLLCIENEGYAGRIGHPARSNHRTIRIPMGEETWYFQYSPYVYYNEHCILLSEEHRKMKISRETFERLLRFVEQFPHYFMGSNADLPIVGGSILSHDHYQGGRYEFPMASAKSDYNFKLKQFPNISASTVKWPMSVIRLQSQDKDELVEASDFILNRWKEYSDPEIGIMAYSNNTPHNTITPIARRKGRDFEVDLVLRNNRTDEKHPLGIFHPHEDVHHIKKENIGLIEVMGLAVLPARLKDEVQEVEKYLRNEPNEIADYHLPWAMEIKNKYGTFHKNEIHKIIQNEIGMKFLKVLSDAGVFKRNEKGQKAFQKFISFLNK